MKKHLLFLFTALLPMLASAEKVEIDGIWYNLITKAKQAEVTYKGDSFESYDEYSGSITIPTTVTYNGVEYRVTSIGEYAFYQCSSLTAITIPEGVTTIGVYAFFGCSGLTKITIPEGVTAIEKLTFQYCSNLAAIKLPESIILIGSQAFDGCSSLTSINIPKGVTSIEFHAFENCSSLTTITLPERITSIKRGTFRSCSSLTAITIPDSVTTIGYEAFYNCSNLTTISIPEGVTTIEHEAFSHCSSLTAISIPTSLTIIQHEAFFLCSSLASITLSESIKYIGSNAFANCSGLLDVYCYADTVPTADANSFDGSYPEYATLHVPESALNDYKTTAPWSSFGTIVSLDAPLTRITLSESSATISEGETLALTITTTPANADRNLITWSSSNTSVATADNTGQVTAIAPGTATITATANDGSGVSASCEVTVVARSYALTFLVDGDVLHTDSLTRDEAITLPETPTKEGYTFSGWGEVPETMPAEDLTISGTFIVNKYLVTFKIGDEVIASDSLEYGAEFVAPEAPEKEGYTFNGWGVVADSVPAHDLTYEGSYSINSYTLTYVVDGEAVLTLPIVYGATIPSLKAPEKEGYKFSGWSEAPETMPAKDVTIEGTFTQLPSIYLTINQADNGCVKQHLVQGTSCTFVIEAAEGWKIHTVTFNGEDVTSQLTEEGTFTTPALQDDAVLNIAYEKIDDAIESARAGAIKVQGHQGIISISGTTEGTDISLYTTDGTLVTRETAEDDTTHLTVPTGQVYIVKVADTVVKIGM